MMLNAFIISPLYFTYLALLQSSVARWYYLSKQHALVSTRDHPLLYKESFSMYISIQWTHVNAKVHTTTYKYIWFFQAYHKKIVYTETLWFCVHTREGVYVWNPQCFAGAMVIILKNKDRWASCSIVAFPTAYSLRVCTSSCLDYWW